jgi:pantetheine-phosphate adenylyltransferase
MEKQGTVIYPGTFDPLTNGHVSIIQRGSRLFETVIVGVAADNSKQPLFSLEERVDMVRSTFADNPAVLAEPFSGLLMDYAAKRGAKAVLRGLRAMSDFDYEFQMALMNRKLRHEIESVFLVTDFRWMYISSPMIQSVAMMGGDVASLVPAPVLSRLRKIYGHPDTWPQVPLPGSPDASREDDDRA